MAMTCEVRSVGFSLKIIGESRTIISFSLAIMFKLLHVGQVPLFNQKVKGGKPSSHTCPRFCKAVTSTGLLRRASEGTKVVTTLALKAKGAFRVLWPHWPPPEVSFKALTQYRLEQLWT